MIKDGLLKDVTDMHRVNALAGEVLTHDRQNRRNFRRVDHKNKGGEKDFKDRTVHPSRNSINCLTDDFIPLPFNFSEQTLRVLQEVGLWEPPEECGPTFPNGIFRHDMLEPKRHMGKVTPGAKEEMSSTNAKVFAFTRSMCNLQVVTCTSGYATLCRRFSNKHTPLTHNLNSHSVSRYVVKVRHMRRNSTTGGRSI